MQMLQGYTESRGECDKKLGKIKFASGQLEGSASEDSVPSTL